MKHLLKLTLAVALLLTASTNAFGQKFGFINSDELIASMPEVDSVRVKLDKLQQDFVSQLELIQVEMNNKYQDWQKNQATYSEAINQMKQKELQDLSQRLQDYQNLAQQELQKSQTELMKPVIEKANIAIEKVAQSGGYIVIFDQSSGATAYMDKTAVENIMPAVKAELGIKE